MTPAVTVLVASVQGTSAVVECLQSLGSRDDTEVVVVDRTGGSARAEIARLFPDVAVLPVDSSVSLPAMRARGMAAATGAVVAVLGDHMRPSPGWVAAIVSHPERATAIVGGPVEAGRLGGAPEWAYFLLEYARFLPPLPAGRVAELPGTNCAYDRRLLDRLGVGDGPVFDAILHGRARELEIPLACDPALGVRCEKRLSGPRFLTQRYHCARVSAARRAGSWPLAKRLAFAAATPLLPPLLLFRLVATLAAKRRHGGELARAFPLVLVGVVVGSWGEAMGALLGPGTSGERAE